MPVVQPKGSPVLSMVIVSTDGASPDAELTEIQPADGVAFHERDQAPLLEMDTCCVIAFGSEGRTIA